MKRTLFLTLLLAACFALPLGLLSAREMPDTWWEGGLDEVEPNDTPAQAMAIPFETLIHGVVGLSGDAIDTFSFTGVAGETIAVIEPESFYQHRIVVTLYDPAMQPVALTPPARWATLPAGGTYTLGVVQDPSFPYSNWYSFGIARLTGDEPNETMDTATPVTIGQTIVLSEDYPCDEDWFVFEGRAGDVFPDTAHSPNFWVNVPMLYDAEGNRLSMMLPSDGTYYLEVAGWWYDDYEGDDICGQIASELNVGRSPWISAAVDGLGGNPALKEEDIVTRRTGGGWQLVFDASDVGITQDVNAIDVLDDGSILMSLLAAQNVPGLGKVLPQDIIRFTPTSLGETTAGSFAWFLDGSDVGLTTAGEKIDAIDMQEQFDAPLRISLTGAGSVPRRSGGTLAVADEDVINLVQTQFGANSAGQWRMSLKGTGVPGMAAEDVNALAEIAVWPSSLSVDLLVMGSAFTINGFSGGPKDLFVLSARRPYEEGIWQRAFANKPIDALTFGPAQP